MSFDFFLLHDNSFFCLLINLLIIIADILFVWCLLIPPFTCLEIEISNGSAAEGRILIPLPRSCSHILY